MSLFQDRNSWDFTAFIIFFFIIFSVSNSFSLYYYLRMCSVIYRFIFPFLSTFYCCFLLICRTIPHPHFPPSLSFFYNNSRAQFNFSYHPQCVAADMKNMYLCEWVWPCMHGLQLRPNIHPWMFPQRLEGTGFLTRTLLIIKNWVV